MKALVVLAVSIMIACVDAFGSTGHGDGGHDKQHFIAQMRARTDEEVMAQMKAAGTAPEDMKEALAAARDAAAIGEWFDNTDADGNGLVTQAEIQMTGEESAASRGVGFGLLLGAVFVSSFLYPFYRTGQLDTFF